MYILLPMQCQPYVPMLSCEHMLRFTPAHIHAEAMYLPLTSLSGAIVAVTAAACMVNSVPVENLPSRAGSVAAELALKLLLSSVVLAMAAAATAKYCCCTAHRVAVGICNAAYALVHTVL